MQAIGSENPARRTSLAVPGHHHCLRNVPRTQHPSGDHDRPAPIAVTERQELARRQYQRSAPDPPHDAGDAHAVERRFFTSSCARLNITAALISARWVRA